MKRFCVALLSAVAAIAIASSPMLAARIGPASASSLETPSDAAFLHPPDPHKELRHLSRDLRLSRDQRTAVGSILQERTREIRLLLDIQPLSPEYRNTLAAKVTEDSNSQIEKFLKSKQKRKFDKELARARQTR